MGNSAATKYGADDATQPPVDLRLVPAAVATWVAILVCLVQVQIAWWLAGIAVLAMPLTVAFRVRWWPGCLVLLGFLVTGVVVTALHLGQAANDPLTAAAGRGSWASLEVTVTGFARAVDAGFVAPENGPGTARADDSRWRVAVSASTAVVAGQTWTSQAVMTVYGTGRAWSAVVPGEDLVVAGRLGTQPQGVLDQLIVRSRDPPRVISAAPWWDRAAQSIRDHLSDNASRLDEDPAGLLPGLVVGDTSGISDRLTADAKTTGIAHLLAVSGSHFAVLCGMVILLLRRLGPRWAAGGGLVTLVGLVVLVGAEPSVLRAAVMGGVGMLALLSGRTRAAVPALAFAVLALLLVDPELALSIGFSLSVVATAGLVVIAPAWSSALQRRGLPTGWADLLAVPVAAQVVTMPLIVTISGSVSVVAVLANLLVAPVVAPALLLGVLCALAGPWWPAGAAALTVTTGPLLDWVAGVAHTLARWPNATVAWPATPTGALALVALTIAAVMVLRHRLFRAMLTAVVAGAALVLLPSRVVVGSGWPAPGWLLTGCEVGQGDAMVLSTGEPGTAVVIDTGPDPDLVDACLSRLGVGTIPLLILTHLHADHIDGLAGALRGRAVGSIAVGPDREPAFAWSTVQSEAAARGIGVVQLPPGVQWASGDLRLTVLAPQKAFQGTDSDPNNDSLVVMAEHDGERMLLTGDVEREAQQAILNSGVDLHADVLKVPHHGSSKLLDAFVRAVSPTVAVIGVGVDNDYGHPSARALDMLTADGVRRILRTDEQGDVSVGVTDGALTTDVRGASAAVG